MFFINALALDKQGRINLSKYFKVAEQVSIIYSECGVFEIMPQNHPKVRDFQKFISPLTVDMKGRVYLPTWVRKLAHSESFLVAIKSEIYGDKNGSEEAWESVFLKPVTIALPAEQSTEDFAEETED